MAVGTEVGILTSVAMQLVVVLEISKILVWKSASRFGDLRQGQAVSRGLRAEENFLCGTPAGAQYLHYWQPFPRSSSNFLWSVHAHRPPYAACVCKRGVGPCARCRGRGAPGLSNARRPTRFARPVPARRARPGPRSPSRAAISPSSEGLSGSHHADKTNFCGGEWAPSQGFFLAQWMILLMIRWTSTWSSYHVSRVLSFTVQQVSSRSIVYEMRQYNTVYVL